MSKVEENKEWSGVGWRVRREQTYACEDTLLSHSQV